MYKNAARLKLRFETPKGMLSAEDLWDLTLPQLNELAKKLNKRLKEFGEDDFLKVKNDEEKIVKLQFDIVLDILKTKQEDIEAAVARKLKMEQKQKLMAALDAKRDADIGAMTVEEIQAKLNELGD